MVLRPRCEACNANECQVYIHLPPPGPCRPRVALAPSFARPPAAIAMASASSRRPPLAPWAPASRGLRECGPKPRKQFRLPPLPPLLPTQPRRDSASGTAGRSPRNRASLATLFRPSVGLAPPPFLRLYRAGITVLQQAERTRPVAWRPGRNSLPTRGALGNIEGSWRRRGPCFRQCVSWSAYMTPPVSDVTGRRK